MNKMRNPADLIDGLTSKALPPRLTNRLEKELEFAEEFVTYNGGEGSELIAQAINELESCDYDNTDLSELIQEIESILIPIGRKAKQFTIHYIAHAHIDMNWLWGWPDTVATTYKTFKTMLQLMKDFPEFRFSQSQVSTYEIARKYSPDIFEKIKEKIHEGRWEVTANTWVEGDKNMSSGEAQIRQILYAKDYLQEHLGVSMEDVKVDWEPDTFGHPITTPKILNNAGIQYYYLHRPGGQAQPDHKLGKYGYRPQLFRWEAPDGSRVLAWNDEELTYNGHINESNVLRVLGHEKKTGMKDYMIVYGVGDHGGGPSRADIETIKEMNEWPIFPNTKFSFAHEYFQLAEQTAKDLPVINDELNFLVRGCYSSQSSIKHANRQMESDLETAETVSVFAEAAGNFKYPKKLLEDSWKKALFNQFHDILPGSGIDKTTQHALGNFQEVDAATTTVTESATDSLINGIYVDTRGDERENSIPVEVFNPTSFTRTDKVEMLVYGLSEKKELIIRDNQGNKYPLQVSESLQSLQENTQGPHSFFSKMPDPPMLMFDLIYDHDFVRAHFIAEDIPPFGYKRFWIEEGNCDVDGLSLHRTKDGIEIGNDQLLVNVEAKSGSITSIFDKEENFDFVENGERFGLLEVGQEEPHEMSAWVKGRISKINSLNSGGKLEVVEEGPVRNVLKYENHYNDSEIGVYISLYRGLREIEFNLNVDWKELGNNDNGIPSLSAKFPSSFDEPSFIYDIPFGNIERPADGKDVPAQKWGAIESKEKDKGLTIVNSHTYGYRGEENRMALTLLRSSCEPDPYPEFGRRNIKFSAVPSGKNWSLSQAEKIGTFLNKPLIAKRFNLIESNRGPSGSFVHTAPEEVMISSVKKSEDEQGIILRLFETEGTNQQAVVHTEFTLARAYEKDILERTKSEIQVSEKSWFEVNLRPNEVKTVELKFE